MATAAVETPRRGRPPKVQSVENGPRPEPKPSEVPFWDWLASLTSDDWNYTICYVWRIEPIINRERNAKEGISIAKYSRPFDMQTLKHEHGSGRYRLDVCRIPVNGSPQSRLRQEYVNVLDMDYPPRVPYGDWLREPENEKWAWSEEILKRRMQESQARIQQNDAPPPQSDPASMLNAVMGVVETLRPKDDGNAGLAAQLLQVILTNQAAMTAMADPAKQLATIQALMEQVRPKGDDSATKEMMSFFRETITDLRQEVRDLRNNQAKPQSLGEQLKEVSAVLSEVAPSLGYKPRGDRSPNSANPGTDLGSIALQVIDRVSERLAPALPMIVSSFFAARSGQAAQPTAPNPAQLPPPAQEVHIDMTKVPEDQKPAVEELQKRMNAVLQKYGQLFEQVAMFMVDQFRADESGEAFRDWFIDRRSRQLWIDLRNDAGPEVMTALIGTHAALKSMMTPPEKVALFFQEFFSEPGEEEPEETA